jgi:hypothetical protein
MTTTTNTMTPQTRAHAAIEYARHERLHSRLDEWNTPSPRCKVGIWLALSLVLWVPIIAAIILLS